MAIITKLDAAHRQLVTAIRLFFDDDDLAAIHTLACAAREIYEKHCAAQGVERMFEYIESANPQRTCKELWGIFNGTRNFLKHPETSLDLSAAIEIDDEMNAAMLWVACHDCAMLCKEAQPPEVQAYTLWYIAARGARERAPDDPANAQAEEIEGQIDRAYPSLRKGSLAEQKGIGKVMVQDAHKLEATGIS